MYVNAKLERRQVWRSKYPTAIGALLSIFQMILTAAIIGCEVGGDFVQFNQMNAFVGYWTSSLFVCAWISLAGASCCCRIRCCGITTLVFQCLSIPMALCVIGFDAYFLNNPTLCFFSTDCTGYNYNYYNYYYYNGTYTTSATYTTNSLYTIKVPLIRGQLAAGVLMFVSCLAYIFIFILTSYRVRKAIGAPNGSFVPPVPVIPNSYGYVPPVPVISNSSGYVPPVPVISNSSGYVPPVPVPPPPYNAPIEISISTPSPVVKNQMICPNCRTRFQIATQRT